MQEQNQEPQNNPESQEAPEQMPQEPNMSGKPEESKGYGALIAMAVIVLIIIVGAYFMFQDRVGEGEKSDAELDAQFDASEGQLDAELEAINSTSEDDTLASIETDLEGSDLSDLDAELDAIDEEFNSAN